MSKHHILIAALVLTACSKSSNNGGGPPNPPPPPPAKFFSLSTTTIDGAKAATTTNFNTSTKPVIRFNFTAPIDHNSAASSITFKDYTGTPITFTPTFENNDSTVVVQPASALLHLFSYSIQVANTLIDHSSDKISAASSLNFNTVIDSSDKNPRITDSALLDLVEPQTFAYFWDGAEPPSG